MHGAHEQGASTLGLRNCARMQGDCTHFNCRSPATCKGNRLFRNADMQISVIWHVPSQPKYRPPVLPLSVSSSLLVLTNVCYPGCTTRTVIVRTGVLLAPTSWIVMRPQTAPCSSRT